MESLKFYKNVTERFRGSLPQPLIETKIDELEIGELFITSHGTRMKKINNNEFEIDKPSDLVDDELVENLTPLQLKAFWNIMNYTE